MEEEIKPTKTPDEILKESIEEKKKEIKIQEKKIQDEKNINKKLNKQLRQREKAYAIYKMTKDA